MPLRCNSSASARSDKGLRLSSASISLRSMAWIAVAEALPPSSVETPLEKKYFSSNVPRGVCMYLRVVTREMVDRSEEHTSELQSLMRISYAVLCLKKKKRRH